jgi:hypothetical protein
MRKHTRFVLIAACLGLSAQLAAAQVVFNDGFETAPEVTPDSWMTQDALPPASRTDADPANTTGVSFSALAGQWFHFAKSAVPAHNIQVTNFNPPVAASGSNYLRLHRAPGTDSANIAAAFTDWNAGLTSGTVIIEWDTYIPAGQDAFVGGFYVTQFLDNDHSGGTTGSLATLFFRGDGSIRQSFGAFSNNPDLPGLIAQTGVWQHWTLTNNLTTQQYTLAIDGVTSASFGYNFPFVTGGGAKGLVFNGQEGKEFYVDNVKVTIPEPASLALLAAGGLVIRRRK